MTGIIALALGAAAVKIVGHIVGAIGENRDETTEADLANRTLAQQAEQAGQVYALQQKSILGNRTAAIRDVRQDAARTIGTAQAGYAASGVTGGSANIVQQDIRNQRETVVGDVEREAQIQLASAALSLEDVQERADLAGEYYTEERVKKRRRRNWFSTGLDVTGEAIDLGTTIIGARE